MKRKNQRLHKRKGFTAIVLAASMCVGTILNTAGIAAGDFTDDSYSLNYYDYGVGESDIAEETLDASDVYANQEEITYVAPADEESVIAVDGQNDAQQVTADEDYGFVQEGSGFEAVSDTAFENVISTEALTGNVYELQASLSGGLWVTARVEGDAGFEEGTTLEVRRLMNNGAEISWKGEIEESTEALEKYQLALTDAQLYTANNQEMLAGALIYDVQFLDPNGNYFIPDQTVELTFAYESSVIANMPEKQQPSTVYIMRGYDYQEHIAEVVNTEKGLKLFEAEETLGVNRFIVDKDPYTSYYSLVWAEDVTADAEDEYTEDSDEEASQGGETGDVTTGDVFVEDEYTEEQNFEEAAIEEGTSDETADAETPDGEASNEETVEEDAADDETAGETAEGEAVDDDTEGFDNTEEDDASAEGEITEAEEAVEEEEELIEGKYVYIIYDQVNLRQEPSTEAELVAVVDAGTKLALKKIVEGEDGYSWYGVDYNTIEYPEYIDIQDEPENEIIPEEEEITEGSELAEELPEEVYYEEEKEVVEAEEDNAEYEDIVAPVQEEAGEADETADVADTEGAAEEASGEPYIVYVRSDMAQVVETEAVEEEEITEQEDIFELKEESEEVVTLTTEINGTTVTMTGPKSSFPEGENYEVTAAELTEEQMDDVEIALRKKEIAEKKKIADYTAYDINLVVDGEIAQPLGNVNVSFSGGEVEEQLDGVKDENVDVFYINEEKQKAVEVAAELNVEEQQVEMVTDHFTIYSITTNEPDGVTITVEHYLWTGDAPNGKVLPQGYKIFQDQTIKLDFLMTIDQTVMQVAGNYKACVGSDGDYLYYLVDQDGKVINTETLQEVNAVKRVSEKHLLKAGATYRIYYDENKPHPVKTDVKMYDYQVAPKTSYNSRPDFSSNNYWTIPNGINANDNYTHAGNNIANDKRFGMGGNGDNTTKLFERYTDTVNKYHAFGMEDQESYHYGCGYYGEVTTGIITGYDPETQYLKMSNGLVDPGVFKDSGVKGNIYLKDYKLVFDLEGDKYTLSGVLNPQGDQVATVKKEDVSKKYPNAVHDPDYPQTSIDFFPLDELLTKGYTSADGQTKISANQFADWANNKSTYSGDSNNNVHNDYFGMLYAMYFQVDEYVGPLEYYFTGDDDLWVIMDCGTDHEKVVTDCGGVHQPVEERTDLWPYVMGIDKNATELAKYNQAKALDEDLVSKGEPAHYAADYIQNANFDRMKIHSITVLWMERGATDSNCYMEFTIPGAHAVPQEPATADIMLVKADSETNQPIKGAEFALYRDIDNTHYHLKNCISDDQGKLNIGKLYEGTYYLIETHFPEGYIQYYNRYKIVVTRNADKTASVRYFIYDGVDSFDIEGKGDDPTKWKEITNTTLEGYPIIPNIREWIAPMHGVKVDEDLNTLSGAKFEFYHIKDTEFVKALDIVPVDKNGKDISIADNGKYISEIDHWKQETVADENGKFDFALQGRYFTLDTSYDPTKDEKLDKTQDWSRLGKFDISVWMVEKEPPTGYMKDTKKHLLNISVYANYVLDDHTAADPELAKGHFEIVRTEIAHACDDLTDDLLDISTKDNKIVFNYENELAPENTPRVSVSKTFEGLTMNQILALVDDYNIKLTQDSTDKATLVLKDNAGSALSPIKILDASGNPVDVSTMSEDDKKKVATYHYIWCVEDLKAATYQISEDGEEVTNCYVVTTGFDVDNNLVNANPWTLTNPTLTTQTIGAVSSDWQNGSGKIVIGTLKDNLGYTVYTKEPLTHAQELKVIEYINTRYSDTGSDDNPGFYTKPAVYRSASVDASSGDTVYSGNTYFFSDADIEGNGFSFGKGKVIKLDANNYLDLTKAKDAWQHVEAGTYGFTGASGKERLADLQGVNEYYIAKLDLKKTTVNGTPVGKEGDYAQFKLSKYDSATSKYVAVTGYENFDVKNDADAVEFNPIQPGRYMLEETNAPNNFFPLTEKIYFLVEFNETTKKFTYSLCDEDGNALATPPTMWELDDTSDTVVITIKNKFDYKLPQSGGRGIYLYTILGTVFMILAAWIIYINKRKGVLIR
ncbi:MAG: hypothetical protein HUJ72_04745 [Blautia sp.]|nr:hypothetical protein [Blautia sp.]